MIKIAILYFIIVANASATLIAHRGIHQTYHREGLTNTTCTASRIDNTGHDYLENTLESIESAFNYYADMVEIDVHPTSELNSREELVVFHDWTLNCRTEATCSSGCNCNQENECETNMQSISYLKSLDIGYGYTYDNGTTFPFRGRGSYLIPTLEDVLELLHIYPKAKLLINVKGNFDRTNIAFLDIISKYPKNIRNRIYYPHRYGMQIQLENLGIQKEIIQADRKCLIEYLKVGWLGIFPKECHNKEIMIPVSESLERVLGAPGRFIKFTSVLWGWPEKFISLAHKHNTKIYASQVDTKSMYDELSKYKFDGMMTNKIEIIGPYSKEFN